MKVLIVGGRLQGVEAAYLARHKRGKVMDNILSSHGISVFSDREPDHELGGPR